ncbi:hypothetical protein ACCC97_19295 [Variovorax sp. Varisp85]|jgi:hypothetical protein|uniref:hypothetical protein n=1 Tax=unclassified Variovorax TaxID=663243 RepID=UPI0002E6A830|nr:hypothetical protein [Variovorax sp. CF313]
MNIPYLDDARIDALLVVPGCASALEAAFTDLALGRATVHARHRTDCSAVKLSTMGALWSARQVWPAVGLHWSAAAWRTGPAPRTTLRSEGPVP